jgi:hypothetical protein
MKLQRLPHAALAFVAAVALTKLFYVYPDLWPSPLKDAGNTLIDAMQINSAEAASDLEFLYVFCVSWVAVTLVFKSVVFLWRRWRPRL